ncbi:MAG: type I restriction enzyme HsdR N-terminal domain-containing protein [Bacteroidales bacterium]|nr:type I restriction enzyme HsdR N-terminal domain-containing protein [Bacteroidales bacterium]
MEWFKTQMTDGRTTVFDPLRRQYVALTPEEQVRQKMLFYLVEKKKMPSGLIAVEYSIKVNNLPKRCDIVIFNNLGKAKMIVECKAESVAINEKVLDQAIRYYSGLKADFLTLTNGKSMFCYKIEDGRLIPQSEFPDF